MTIMNPRTFYTFCCYFLISVCVVYSNLLSKDNDWNSLSPHPILGNEEDIVSDECLSVADCNYLGQCRKVGGKNICRCYEGISGKNCTVVEECRKNPNMCGDDPEAECSLSINHYSGLRKAVCECKEGNRFDVPTKKCVPQKSCLDNNQCQNYGWCEKHEESKSEVKYCKCHYGTSGDFCERIEECISNSKFCGDGDDVECRLNSYLERAYCQCKDPNHRFDLKEKKCVNRTECETDNECRQFGICTNKCQIWEPCLDYDKTEDKKSCHCAEGTSGHNCEVIDDCINNVTNCGENSICKYTFINGLTAKSYCECTRNSQKFDQVEKQCKDCDCGPKGYCSFLNGKKTCDCNLNALDLVDRCEDCKCGEQSTGCFMKDGVKQCICKPGFKVLNGICEDCACGINSNGCKFENGKKVCICKPGFTQGDYGACTAKCDNLHKCANGGRCLNDICICLPGTGGPYCRRIFDCEDNLCGTKFTALCQYDERQQRATCSCRITGEIFDSVNKVCAECRCGNLYSQQFALKCEFSGGKKVCHCIDKYSYNEKDDECSRCDCGVFAKGCSFDKKGEKVCQCNPPYISDRGMCEECSCGQNGVCNRTVINHIPTKVCTCDYGYAEYSEKCEKCDCGANGKCELMKYKMTPKCTCDLGFAENSGKCQFCDCGPSIKCSFKNKRKVCECKSGYEDINGYCTDVDECANTKICTGEGRGCVNTMGSYKCSCKFGYKEQSHSKNCIQIEEKQDYNGWKVGYAIMSVGFVIIIGGLIFIIFRLKRNPQTGNVELDLHFRK